MLIGLVVLVSILLAWFMLSSNNVALTTVTPTPTNTPNPTVKPQLDMNTSPTPILGQKMYSAQPVTFLNSNERNLVRLNTNLGEIVIELFANETPIAANNFAFLAKDGFYDGTTFHRVIKDFMIQGGDPKGDGTGGPGYKFNDESITREYTRGTVAYANAGPNTNGSQFFVMHADYPLSPQYVIFGQVVEGLDVVDAIANSPVQMNAQGEPSTPKSRVVINSATLIQGAAKDALPPTATSTPTQIPTHVTPTE